MYGAALANGTLRTLEHATFLFEAAIFWRMVAASGDRRLDPGMAILLLTLVGLRENRMAAA